MDSLSKISVRHFIKENEQAQRRPFLGESKNYSITVQATFRRKNTQFGSAINNTYPSMKRAKELDSSRFEREADIIKQIIRYEAGLFGEKYSLAGLKDRYRKYSIELAHYINVYFRDLIDEALEKSASKFAMILDPHQKYDVSVRIYYEAFIKLIEDSSEVLPKEFNEKLKVAEKLVSWCGSYSSEATTIDWIDGSLQKKYVKYLESEKMAQNLVKEHLGLLNRIIIAAFNID